MYNRYIPQQDGTYRKNSIPTPPPPPPEPVREEVCMPPTPHRQPEGAGSFLRQLIPQNLDTGDLLVILLLLLMAGDCQENRNNWLLTLALYLFL